MSEIKTLLMLELRSFYGINKMLHTKDPKEKSRSKTLTVAWIILIGMLFVYIGILSYGLCTLGLAGIVPAYLTVISSALVMFFGLFSAGNRIFGQRSFDILASMPIKTKSIVISRFLGLYIADFIFCFLIIFPGLAVYGYCERPNVGFYLLSAVSTLFIPAVPLVLSVLFGTLVFAISSRMKKKSAIQSLLSVALVVGIMVGSYSLESLTENLTSEQFFDVASLIGGMIGNIYLPAMWVNSAIIEKNALYLLLFVAVSAALVLLTVIISAKAFNPLVRRLSSFSAKHNYKIGKMESRGLLKALYLKEAKRYFSSSIYVTNTVIGPILGTVMAVALCVVGAESLKESFPLPFDAVNALPFVFSAVFCMMTTTSVSISMEGKQFWVVKSLPIPTKTVLDSKILLNISLMLPFYAVSQVALAIAFKPNALQLLWLVLIPMSVILFVTVFGITVNLRFHSFDWEYEATVVKQSLPAALGGFAGPIVCILLGVISVVLIPSRYSDFAMAGVSAVLLTVTVLLYKSNNKKRLESL